MLGRIGLTYPQYLVMLVLWDRGDTTIGGLCRALHLETGTLSPLLKRLEATGLIRRRRRQDDERSVMIGLTSTGVELRKRAAAAQGAIGEAAGLTEAGVADLRDTLHALAEQLRSSEVAADTA
ncbi:MAG: MarR family winged helix-turn-helix transcriptional regulator [Pseudonocardia sp.]